jgi:hypothetical protein
MLAEMQAPSSPRKARHARIPEDRARAARRHGIAFAAARRLGIGLTIGALILIALGRTVPAQQSGPLSLLEPAVSAWIVRFREGAIERGVEPIPADIRAEFLGFVPEDVLDGVRWRVDGTATVAGLGIFGLRSALAITLDDVILFSGTEDAADIGIWAHELCHAIQFRRWGMTGFVQRYLADDRAVEFEAKEFRYRWELVTGRLGVEIRSPAPECGGPPRAGGPSYGAAAFIDSAFTDSAPIDSRRRATAFGEPVPRANNA